MQTTKKVRKPRTKKEKDVLLNTEGPLTNEAMSSEEIKTSQGNQPNCAHKLTISIDLFFAHLFPLPSLYYYYSYLYMEKNMVF